MSKRKREESETRVTRSNKTRSNKTNKTVNDWDILRSLSLPLLRRICEKRNGTCHGIDKQGRYAVACRIMQGLNEPGRKIRLNDTFADVDAVTRLMQRPSRIQMTRQGLLERFSHFHRQVLGEEIIEIEIRGWPWLLVRARAQWPAVFHNNSDFYSIMMHAESVRESGFTYPCDMTFPAQIGANGALFTVVAPEDDDGPARDWTLEFQSFLSPTQRLPAPYSTAAYVLAVDGKRSCENEWEQKWWDPTFFVQPLEEVHMVSPYWCSVRTKETCQKKKRRLQTQVGIVSSNGKEVFYYDSNHHICSAKMDRNSSYPIVGTEVGWFLPGWDWKRPEAMRFLRHFKDNTVPLDVLQNIIASYL